MKQIWKNGNNSEFEKINKIEWWKRKRMIFFTNEWIACEDGKQKKIEKEIQV